MYISYSWCKILNSSGINPPHEDISGSYKVNRMAPLPGQSIPVRASSPTPTALRHALQAPWTRPLKPPARLACLSQRLQSQTPVNRDSTCPPVESRVLRREPPPLRIASFATPTDAPVSLDPPSDQAAITTRYPGLSQSITSKRLTCPACLSLVLSSHRVQRLGGQFMGALADPRRY
jgi:hypothetical protein